MGVVGLARFEFDLAVSGDGRITGLLRHRLIDPQGSDFIDTLFQKVQNALRKLLPHDHGHGGVEG